VRFLTAARDIPLLQNILLDLEPPGLPLNGYWELFPQGIKWLEQEADHHIVLRLKMSAAVP
jgi:hypothetical protein